MKRVSSTGENIDESPSEVKSNESDLDRASDRGDRAPEQSSPDDPKAAFSYWTRDPLIGSVLQGRYSIVSMIGKGGTSCVYSAQDLQSHQSVALKILHSHLSSEAVILKRFEQEAKRPA